ncbi:MAG: outer membrane protein assembly factor BamA [Brevundimonas sp.]|uniref:outer membrane protein assembly factor BamA n=1 Tax=Brevundimonas sp. TaxID=1871086 RepID=UPI0027195704|nr:outer membrane protein assembly factor BamA [Brevundimonas sp.]MDO9586325.1 outer membrane protein assembly factor BamA [Brevundimonas sp.]MDZ4110036.1 outer membrane protein assembly factor BamA [Brevundimonas sp.]
MIRQHASALRFARALSPSLLALAVAAGLATPALAQAPVPGVQPGAPAEAAPAPDAAPEEQRLTINRILVRGNQRIDQTTVLSYLPIQPGDTVDASVLDVAVRTLTRTQLFADVQLGIQPNGDLIVEIVENPIINQVVFEGNGAISEAKLREEVTLRPRGIYTRARIQEDVGKIVELYRLSGRISATVTPKIVQLEQNRVDVVFEIDEGPETGVRSITFLGNSAFSDSDLRGVMVTEQSAWWRLFTTNDNYDPNRLDYDREQLRKFYTNRGYYDFRVLSAISELAPDDRAFAITLTVEEGDRYNFGDINIVTENDRLNPDFLKLLLPIRSGDLYESDKIESAVDALTFAAGSAGYAFVEIEPNYSANPETDTVDVTFNIKEGQRVYVDRINIIGNTRTLDNVVRREMMLTEGDAFNRTLLERSRNNLRALGFFKDVTVAEGRGSAPDRSVVNVTVTEQPTGELSVGAGFSSVDAFVVNLGITERNFRGRGQNVVARLEWGSLRQQIDFRFTEPKFLGRDLRAGFDAFHSRYDLSEYSSYDYRSTGGGVRVSYPLNGYTLFSTRYFLKSDEIIVPQGYCGAGGGANALCDQVGSFLNSSAGYTLLVDRRNDPIRPTRGWSGSLRQDFAGVGGDVNYIKTEADVSAYWGISPNWVVTATASTGYISGWGGDPIRINDRFFKGGNSFRGFETAGIGPRDITPGTNNDALGGNFYAIGTLELTVPNGLPDEYGIRTSLFTDVGTLGMLDRRYTIIPTGSNAGMPNPFIVDELELRASAGVSIHWRSPMGPIRFDLSHILGKQEYDKTETFRFSTSTQF